MKRRPPPISEQVKRNWQRCRLDYSAGGVAFRRAGRDGLVEVALIATRGGTRWQLPKGSREAGETSVETAIREVREEVGLTTEPVQFLETIEFWYWDTYRKEIPELVQKKVDFYLLRVTGGTISDQSYEVDGVAWFSMEQALAVLTFDGEREVAEQAARILAEQPTDRESSG